MFLFGRRKAAPDPLVSRSIDEVEKRVAKLEHELRILQTEQTVLHDQVRKWMRRAVAAERVVQASESQDEEQAPAPAPAAPPGAPRWGARGRRAARVAGLAHARENGDG